MVKVGWRDYTERPGKVMGAVVPKRKIIKAIKKIEFATDFFI